MTTTHHTAYSICPKCTDNVPTFYRSEDDNTFIKIVCQCGYEAEMSMAEYVELYEKTPKRPTPDTLYKCKEHNLLYTNFCSMCDIHLCDTCNTGHENRHEFDCIIPITKKVEISYLRKQLKEAYEYLDSYFPSLKEKVIERSKDLKEQIEIAYKQFYDNNKQILDYYKIIFDNFVENNYPFQHIIDDLTHFNTNPKNFIAFNIYHHIEDKNDNSVIDFFNSYRFFRSEEYKMILFAEDIVQCVIFLKDKRIGVCVNRDPAVLVLDPSNDYHIDLKISGHRAYETYSITELENGDIVAGTYDKLINVYSITKNTYKKELTIEKAHNREVQKVITLSNNLIASAGSDNLIKIWDISTYTKKEPIQVLKGHTFGVYSLLYIKEKNVLISGGLSQDDLHIWNLDTYQCVNVFAEVQGYSHNSLYQLDEERIVAGGSGEFYIININKLTIEEKVDLKEFDVHSLSAFMKLRDGNLLCGTSIGNFILYNMKTKKVINISTSHVSMVTDIKRIDDHSFYTASCDLKFRLWKY